MRKPGCPKGVTKGMKKYWWPWQSLEARWDFEERCAAMRAGISLDRPKYPKVEPVKMSDEDRRFEERIPFEGRQWRRSERTY